MWMLIKPVFNNCRFLGNQDTIYAGGENSRQLFTNCYIEGTTDFIFGPSTAVFSGCIIRGKSDSYITAANTPTWNRYGFVFVHCRVIADSTVKKLWLGRPWRAYARVVFMQCELPDQVAREGWHNWDNPQNEATVFYAEYKNTGKGAQIQDRVKWSKQLSDTEATAFSLGEVFNNQLNPASLNDTWWNDLGLRDFKWR
jgi:pectinesterase